jgi:hypothetical protein
MNEVTHQTAQPAAACASEKVASFELISSFFNPLLLFSGALTFFLCVVFRFCLHADN